MTGGSAARCIALLAGPALVGLIAGCTSSGQAEQSPSPSEILQTTPSVSSPAASTPASAAPTTLAQSSSTADTSTAVSSTPASSTPAGESSTPAGPQTTCTQLSVRVIPGGASFGEQIAGLQFTNEGTTTCVLAGYPTVSLLLDGRVIGQPSQPASDAESLRRLRPGEVAESLLHDYTQTCQAPLSDSVRVQVPGSARSPAGHGTPRLRPAGRQARPARLTSAPRQTPPRGPGADRAGWTECLPRATSPGWWWPDSR